MKKSELKKYIKEALTSDEAAKVDSKYKDIYSGMLRDNPLKLKKYDNPDAVAYGRAIKLVQKESKLAKESKTEKQRKWACAQVDSKSRPKGLSKSQAKEMCSDTGLSKNENMENTRLQELIKSALKGPVKEEAPVDESFDSLAKKLDKQKGIDKEEAAKIAGSIAQKKLKGAGKGPTAKQKARMAEDKDWIQKAIKRPGALHRALDIPQDEDIPKSLINKDIKKMDKKEDEEGKLDPKDLRFLRQLDLAKTLEKFNENKLTERILKELRGNVNEAEVSPEVAAGKALKVAGKLEKAPLMDKLAAKVAKNPTLMTQLEKAVKLAGVKVELTEDESGLDMGDLKTMALNSARRSKKINEIDDDEDVTGALGGGMAAVVGGGALGATFGSTILSAVPAVASVFAGPALVGALAGVGLFILARKVYRMSKNAKSKEKPSNGTTDNSTFSRSYTNGVPDDAKPDVDFEKTRDKYKLPKSKQRYDMKTGKYVDI